MIGRLHHVIMDCPDPAALAGFWSALLGLPVTWQQDDFAVVSVNDTTSGVAFQRVADYRPPHWPDPARPQQLHFDVMVDDVATAGPQVQALGAPARRRCRVAGVRRPGRAPVLPDSPAVLGAAGRRTRLTLPQGQAAR